MYFPTIEFQSDAWLKSALCVWEKIYRIVPSSYTPQDSHEVKQAIDAGLIESVKLSEADLAKTAGAFQKFMDEAAEFPAALQGYENVRLHEGKVDARILPLLRGLAKKIDPNGWLSVSEAVADSYMLFLSKIVAQRRGLTTATDNEDIFTVFSFYGFEGNFESWITNPEASEAAASLVLPNLLPKGIEAESMERVLEFRKNYEEARVSYRHSVEKLSKELSAIDDRNHATELLLEFESKLAAGKASGGSKRFPGFGDLKHSTLVVGIPVAVATILADKEGLSWGVAAKSTVLALVGTMADAAKSTRAKWKSSDAYYHLKLHETFLDAPTRDGPMPRYRRTFHEFMDD